MNEYHDYNDAKGRDSRVRTQINRAERAKAAIPFEGTLVMTKRDVWRARIGGALAAHKAQSIVAPRDAYARNFDR